jgi:hypothetical protein
MYDDMMRHPLLRSPEEEANKGRLVTVRLNDVSYLHHP